MSGTRAEVRRRTLERRAATERVILDAMDKLLEGRAFRDVTVDDVMSVAGLSRTAFYRYFPDLESVLLQLMGEVLGSLQEAASHWLETEGDVDGLRRSARALASVYCARGRLLLAFSEASVSGSDIEQAWRVSVDSFIDSATERLESLTAKGLADISNPLETARAIVWMTERYLLETFGRRSTGGLSVDEAAETLVLVWHRVIVGSG